MAKSKKLDKTKDYAEVIGMAGVRYEQSGAYFNSEESEVVVTPSAPMVDKFTTMDTAALLSFLEDNKVKVEDGASDEELRAECREVFI